MLTGHGAFGEYLHRFSIQDSPKCLHCDAVVDSVEDTLFVCFYWDQMRTRTTGLVGHTISPEDVETILCGPGQDQIFEPQELEDHAITRWAFLDMVEDIMIAKEAAERERQRL